MTNLEIIKKTMCEERKVFYFDFMLMKNFKINY